MSPITSNDLALGNAVFAVLPQVIDLVKSFHKTANPGVPPPTDAEVIAALQSAAASTIAIDEAVKARLDPPVV